MTCIVALKDNKDIYLGGDSCVSGSHEQILGRPKINKKGEFLIGGAGSLRALQIMFYSAKLPNRVVDEDYYHYFVNTVASCYRNALKEQGYLKVKDGVEKTDTSFIIAYRGSIYYMGAEFSVDHKENYSAIGSGSYYALGSLHATEKSGLPPQERVLLALDAASKFNGFVSPPYELIRMHWDGYKNGDKYIFYDSDKSVKLGFLKDDVLNS